MAAVTRLGLYGGPRTAYGTFSAKDEWVIVSIAQDTANLGVYETNPSFAVWDTGHEFRVYETNPSKTVRAS